MSRYEPSAQLRKSVEKGDASFVREVLQAILNCNTYPDGEIRDALDWAAAKMPHLFDGFKPDVEPFRSQQSAWDADYYYAQKAALWDDFSRERFEHLVAIRDGLRARGVAEFRRVEAGQRKQSQTPTEGQDSQRQGGGAAQVQEEKPYPVAGIAVAVIGVLAVCVWVAFKLITKRVR